jgi:hypothetical protein
MKYICEFCNYTTANKSNFNKHLKSASHSQKNKSMILVNPKSTFNVDHKSTKQKIKKVICQDCGREFSHKQSLSRHKLNSCPENKQNNKLEEKINILASELQNRNELIDKLIDLVSTTRNVTTNNTYNISVKNYIQQNYPNAPPLKGIDDYSRLQYHDYNLLDTLVYNYNQNNLHKYLGNFVVSHYKKDDPTEQSIWSSDTSRLTYIISELLTNKKSVWTHDYKGTKVKEFILKPLLEYIRDYISSYFANIKVKKNKHYDLTQMESECTYRLNVAKIAEIIDNNVLIDNIIKYMTPYFCIDRDKELQITNEDNIKQMEYFIDK